MAKFTFNDAVRVKRSAASDYRPGELASVVMVHEGSTRWGSYMDRFPVGAVYTIEFEDGHSVNLHEQDLERGAFPNEPPPAAG
jgi:hypothetical protein